MLVLGAWREQLWLAVAGASAGGSGGSEGGAGELTADLLVVLLGAAGRTKVV
jgi:hypothetical protein